MSGSRTITADEGRLPNVHPGDVLREDFLLGSEIGLDEVAGATGVPRSRLIALLEARAGVDADTDLRLGRYLGVSEGFFLRLQNFFDLEEARRMMNGDLDRIAPRAVTG
jgi:addiction module HigA family antidote